jgi:type I restriction enzyme, S subunit
MILSEFIQQCILDKSAGTALKYIGIGSLSLIIGPIPPLAEQHRIVAKVDELMALCDELETQITSTSTTRRQLLEATLQEALAVN